MTALADRLRAEIAAQGPISVARYMEVCLTDPEYGYYVTHDPLGAAGDFITAPEVSQMFGEMLGLWCAAMWQAMGAPERLSLVEFGPGRGTLMADALRAAQALPGFRDALEVYLVEASPVLRARQAKAVPGAQHVEGLAQVPDNLPCLVLGNEYLDALPVRQFQRIADGWAERMVGLQDGALAFVTGPPQALGALDLRFPAARDGAVVEVREGAEDLMRQIASRGATALFLDYGDWDGIGNTLQAVRAHDRVGVFESPGAADLTAHVGFGNLVRAAAPLHAHFTTQGAFLERLGITARAEALAAQGDYAQVAPAHRRLTHPDEMGTLFKAMALTPGPQTPPGFGDD